MKKSILLIFLLLGLSCYGQTPFKGFFRPLDRSLFQTEQTIDGNIKADEGTSIWLMRPSFTISAMEITLSKENGKVFDIASLTKAGFGLSYSHFISVNNLPYNNYSINGMVLFNIVPTETTALNISPTIAIHAFEFVDFGIGYDTGQKRLFGLLGINYNFSR